MVVLDTGGGEGLTPLDEERRARLRVLREEAVDFVLPAYVLAEGQLTGHVGHDYHVRRLRDAVEVVAVDAATGYAAGALRQDVIRAGVEPAPLLWTRSLQRRRTSAPPTRTFGSSRATSPTSSSWRRSRRTPTGSSCAGVGLLPSKADELWSFVQTLRGGELDALRSTSAQRTPRTSLRRIPVPAMSTDA